MRVPSFKLLIPSLILVLATIGMCDTKTSKVNTVQILGTAYSTTWKGGLFFTLLDTPSNVSYFAIAPDDVSLDRFYNALMAAKSKGWDVVVVYTLGGYCPNGKCESYVNNISIK
jgi:hypothetical protein